ncbi:thioredoxin TrxC [Roseateles sp.]|jgi:thioredoxin 2|uniref:thioredoxin TrxC n=1 Tax=Roseateles sp. TaxID=1971397 RepID=UPI0037C78558
MIITCPHCLTKNRVPAERAAQDPVCGHCKAGLLTGDPVVLTEANFDAVIAGSELPVVVDFWAAWCGPCRMMAPHFAQAAQQLKGQALFVKVDSDANPRLSQQWGIRSLPTLLLIRGGQEQGRISGAMQAPQILQWLMQQQRR